MKTLVSLVLPLMTAVFLLDFLNVRDAFALPSCDGCDSSWNWTYSDGKCTYRAICNPTAVCSPVDTIGYDPIRKVFEHTLTLLRGVLTRTVDCVSDNKSSVTEDPLYSGEMH